MNLKNAINHFILVTHHKWVVFKLCCKIGEPWRGFMHDWSKYMPTEFMEGVKYYTGKRSPIMECREKNGYSMAWIHHKGRNKHHTEYWYDEMASEPKLIMPYKYAAEMICDKLAAGMIYQGKNFTEEYELKYWEYEKENVFANEKIKDFTTEVLTQVAEKGMNYTLKKEKLREIYKKHCE